MPLIGRIGIFIISLIGLVKSSDYFTNYSEKLGLSFGLSSFIIGATIVALGTSLPELISGIYAVTAGGLTDYVIDGAVGSNIANVLLVFGLGGIAAKKLEVHTKLIDVDLPFLFISMSLFLFFAWDKVVTRQESIFLLAFIIIFIGYSIQSGEEAEASEDIVPKDYGKIAGYIGIIVVSMGILALSAKYFIDSILEISTILGVTSSILTISVVALGTSLPEVITSMYAIKRGNYSIAFGNVFGSNTYNLTLITGVPAFFGTLTVSDFTATYGFGFLIIVTLLTIILTLDDKLVKREGIALLLLYVVFISKLVGLV